MSDVCVITGGGSGMGLAAAKFLPKEKRIVVSGRTESKLQKAAAELQELGYAIATLADERNGYLAGVDVLCDGGSTNGKRFRKNA
ncbi:MAG: SDR family NAD(P)-dependent oxidoreductase [Clostridiales bacterium]|nr:SDR family NAD(P)-dependent oxidoreductase [Clostridiales bacterium]